MDCLGAAESPKDYVVAGTAATEMHGCAEALWHEDMAGEELFECVSQTLLSGCDRNAASGNNHDYVITFFNLHIQGWGATVTLIEDGKITTRTLKARMD